MSGVFRHSFVALALWGTAACRSDRPLIIGDANTRPLDRPSIITLVRQDLDSVAGSARARVNSWSSSTSTGVVRETEQALRFANDPNVLAAVGHSGSRASLLGASVYNTEHLPQIVPEATSRRLAQAGPWTFRMVPNDSVEGAFLADMAHDSLHANRVTIFYVGDEYGIGLRDGIVAGLAWHGQQPIDVVRLPDMGCSDDASKRALRAVVFASMQRVHPEVAVLAVRSGPAACVVRLVDEFAPDVRFLGGDAVVWEATGIVALADSLKARLRTVSFWEPSRGDPTGRHFVERATRLLGRPPTASETLTYDAFMLLATGIREGHTDREELRRWLLSLGRTRPAFPGVTGPIAFASERRALLRLIGPPEPAR